MQPNIPMLLPAKHYLTNPYRVEAIFPSSLAGSMRAYTISSPSTNTRQPRAPKSAHD